MTEETKKILETLQAAGWSVAQHIDSHFDFATNGRLVSWLLTHGAGVWIFGKGKTDEEAFEELPALAAQRMGWIGTGMQLATHKRLSESPEWMKFRSDRNITTAWQLLESLATSEGIEPAIRKKIQKTLDEVEWSMRHRSIPIPAELSLQTLAEKDQKEQEK
jgi:hypothetical protein